MTYRDPQPVTDRTSIAYMPSVGEDLVIVKEGKVIRKSYNLRGLITHANRAGVAKASVHASGDTIQGEGLVYVVFKDGSWCRVRFASFTIARNFFRSRWKKWGLYAEVRNSDTFWSFI